MHERYRYISFIPPTPPWGVRGVPTRVSYQTDDGAPSRHMWTKYREGRVEHSWPPRLVVDEILAALHGGANRLVIEFLPDEGDATVVTFVVRGFEEAIKPVQEHCEATN